MQSSSLPVLANKAEQTEKNTGPCSLSAPSIAGEFYVLMMQALKELAPLRFAGRDLLATERLKKQIIPWIWHAEL